MQALALRCEASGESESDRRRASWQSVKKDVNALEVGFQQSSIETTLARANYIAKQVGRCKTRKTSTVAKLSDASKMQHNDMIVGIPIALTSKTDALLNLQVSAFRTLMKEQSGSSLKASEKEHSFIPHLLKSKQSEIAVVPPEKLAMEVLMGSPRSLHGRCQRKSLSVSKVIYTIPPKRSSSRSRSSPAWTS